jgi:hypothetical protein
MAERHQGDVKEVSALISQSFRRGVLALRRATRVCLCRCNELTRTLDQIVDRVCPSRVDLDVLVKVPLC